MRALQPELLLVENNGRIAGVVASDCLPEGCETIRLPGRALLPGMVNAHSHAFQRLLRGRADRAVERRQDGLPADFWSWRDVMYAAALPLSPEDLYDVSRMCFLEMALAGITTVGEFHYVHRAPDGSAYEDGNLLAKTVIAAARSVGLRIVLLRCAYLRSGYQMERDPGQRRFFEQADEFLRNAQALTGVCDGDMVRMGIAPHSTRAVPLPALKDIVALGRDRKLPIHMHVAEQRGELDACIAEYGATPIALLEREGLLDARFTGIHAIHVTESELDAMARADATVCACPTTERNLGDGIFPADAAAARGIRVAFGSDSQAQIGPLEDARELEYHLRLRDEKRLRLELINNQTMAARLFRSVSKSGAESLGLDSSVFTPGSPADAFTLDLDHVSLAGVRPDDLLSAIVFGAQPGAVKETFVNGSQIVSDGLHAEQQTIIERYAQVARRVWQ